MDRPDPSGWKWKAMQSIQVTAKRGSPAARVQRAAGPLLALLLALVTALAAPAAASRPAEAIVLPGASSAEGIAAGRGTTFYAGDFLRGDIFRGDIHRGTAEVFIDAPDGRMAVGMAADLPHHLLFVAGGFGQAQVYDTRTGATVASYQFADPETSIVNDVAVTRDGAWFTDSLQAHLYFVPVSRAGVPGPFRALGLSGPAADTSGEFNLNGIQATANGKTLIVAHSTNGELYTVDPTSGASARIAGVSVPGVDGIALEAGRLWAVQTSNQVSRIRLRPDLGSGVVEKVITSDLFQFPTTAARFGGRLAVVNAKFDTPAAERYEVILVDT
jgi:sugar lactone lactonase YvrE